MIGIEEMGEESGRDEAADEYPYQDENADYRELTWRGRGRAQGSIYDFRGKRARKFAHAWAIGYAQTCMTLRNFAGLLGLPDYDDAHVYLCRSAAWGYEPIKDEDISKHEVSR